MGHGAWSIDPPIDLPPVSGSGSLLAVHTHPTEVAFGAPSAYPIELRAIRPARVVRIALFCADFARCCSGSG